MPTNKIHTNIQSHTNNLAGWKYGQQSEEKEPPHEEAVVKLPNDGNLRKQKCQNTFPFSFLGKNLASSKNSKVQRNLWLAIRILIISSGNDSATE